MKATMESHYGKSLWKTTMEDHYGRPLWKTTMEDHYGRPLWKTTMEDHYGRPLWKTTMEDHYGRPLWKTTMEDHYGRPLWKTTMEDHYGRHLIGRHQADAGMVMLLIVPIEEAAAERLGVLDAAEAPWKLRLVFHGFEVAFRERIVVGGVRPAVRFGDAEI